MKALLLAAGFGTRLGPLTKEIPKPLIEVNGQPILDFCIRKILSAGVNTIVVNTHYRAEAIEAYINSQEYASKIIVSYEEELLGTGGTLRKHIDFLAESDFFVMHSDNYFEGSLLEMLISHEARSVGSMGTAGTFITSSPEQCGILVLNEDQTISEFHEKVLNPPSNLANAATYIFTPGVKPYVLGMPDSRPDISRDLVQGIAGNLYTYHFPGAFFDIGTPENLNYANQIAKN
jgi:mannose-1-phosphate guanylyltransferase